MTIFRREVRSGLRGVVLWGLSISALMVIIMTLFPRVERRAELVTQMMSGLNLLTMALGIDKLEYATPMGFYGIEAGNIMSLGGALYAGITGISMLAKEEGRHTSEYLMSHPVGRFWVVTQKLMALTLLLLLMNVIFLGFGFVAFALVARPVVVEELLNLHLAMLLMMLQIGFMLFGVSAFLRRENPGLGIGIPLMFYFFNVLLNLSPDMQFLRYVTPHYYADAGKIVGMGGAIPWHFVTVGGVTALVFLLLGYIRYLTKDLAI